MAGPPRRPDGAAHLVVHKHLGSDSLARWLTEQGFAVVRRTSHQGYRLLDVRPPLSAAVNVLASLRSRT